MNFFILRAYLVAPLMHKVNDPLQGDNARLIHCLPSYLRMEELLEETLNGQLRVQFQVVP